ncbi:MAG: hypothetical protein WC045_03320 [Patescibacteria group bacterium]
MKEYTGIIIEESLSNKDILTRTITTSTKVEPVTPEHKTPWLTQWTLHTVEIPEESIEKVSEEISKSFDPMHLGSWYVDFKNDTHHYIIYPEKVFYVDRSSVEQYNEASRYGISIGIPDYQVDFSSHVKQWDR